MRYLVAILFAILLVAVGWWFVRDTRGIAKARFDQYRNELKAKKEAGQLPAEMRDVDIEHLQPSQVAFHVNASEKTRLNIADALTEYAYIWMAVALVVCLAAVLLWDAVRGRKT